LDIKKLNKKNICITLLYFLRERTLSCTYSGRNDPPPEPELPPENQFVRVRRLTKEHIQAIQENPITFHCCPPEGTLARLLTLAFATFAILLAAEAVLGYRAAPGGNIFALLILILFALIGGFLVRVFDVIVHKCCKIDLRLPALLGMLVVGIMLKNILYNVYEMGQTECMDYNQTDGGEEIQHQWKRSIPEDPVEDDSVHIEDTTTIVNCEPRYIGHDLDPKISTMLRTICLTVILLMAGLEIDPVALWNLSGMVLRATFVPCFVECIVIAVMSNLVLGFPWTVGFMLGFVLAAVSPAVIIPCLVSLSGRGYGVEKGIPTLVIAASSADDVVAISGFGIFLGLTFFQDASMVQLMMHGPIEVLLGVSFGTIWGLMAQWIPHKQHRNVTFFRWIILLSGGLLALFRAHWLKYDGAGGLATIIMAFVAGMQWRKEGWGDHNPVTKVFTKMWIILEPLIFGLIGTEIQIDKIDPETLGWGILVLVTALLFRMVGTFLAVSCGNLNAKEKIFLAFAWMPKATVQAALGPIFLERAKLLQMTEMYQMGEQILTLAVLSILITAPLGAVTIMGLGPKLLEKKKNEEDEVDGEDSDPENDAQEMDNVNDVDED
jgi:NhaP-type Na+/H+ or K+/H+ antiporter